MIQEKSPPGRGKKSIPKVMLSIKLGNGLFLVGFPLLALMLFESYARGGVGYMIDWMTARPVLFLHNLGLFMGVFWLLALIRSDRIRMSASILLTLLLCVLGITSHYKTVYRFEPILLTDLWLLGEMTNTLQQLELKIDWVQAGLTLGLGVGATAMAWALVRGVRKRRGVLAPLAGAALFGALIALCAFESPLLSTGGDIPQDLSVFANRGGTAYTLVAMEKQRLSIVNYAYQEEDMRKAWEEAKAGVMPDAAETPNVIFVLAESFTDQRHLEKYLDFTEPLAPFYEELVKGCASGDIYVPKMGGGTSETEFEVLTGIESRYSVNPYSIGIPKLHSVAATLRERGYEATAIHWFDGIFYNRYKNHRLLGFDALHTADTISVNFEKIGMFVSDAAHYRSVLSQLKKSPGKDFVFCITMQNHGTYGYDDFAVTYGAGTPFSNRLTASSELIIRNYCYLLRQSDLALEEFVTRLEAFEEPTLVVFFGDHIPPFGQEVYQEMGMAGEEEGHFVPYFIWSNQGNTPKRADMKAWQLGAYALSLAGVNSDPFFQHVEALRENGLNQDETYKLLSYDALFGKQKAYEWAGYAIESDHWQIGGRMELLGFDTALIDGAVYVMPRLADPTQKFRLSVNGQPLDDWYVLETTRPFTLQCALSSPSGKYYNHSEAMTFSSSQDLLEKSGSLAGEAISLSQVPFQVEKEENAYFLAVSDRLFKAPLSCLTLDEKRLQWQPSYGIKRAGQYHVAKEEAPLRIAIEKKSFEGHPLTPDGIADYLEAHDAKLWLFE